MKEFPGDSKNKWTRIFKKKWFFPALYMVLAIFILSGVVWYQNVQSKMFGDIDDLQEADHQKDDFQSENFDEEAKSVVNQEETIKMPVQEEAQTEIVTTFYDYTADEEAQEKGLTFYNNRYYQSTGVDIAANDGEDFDVTASLSGTVEDVKQDPLHGNVVELDHGDEITTYYASLEDVKVKKGDKVKQGDKLGSAGNSLFGEESGTHVHFEISKQDIAVNPEDFFNQSFAALQETDVDNVPKSELTEETDQPDADESEDIEEDTEKDTEEEEDAEEDVENDTQENEGASKDLSYSLPG